MGDIENWINQLFNISVTDLEDNNDIECRIAKSFDDVLSGNEAQNQFLNLPINIIFRILLNKKLTFVKQQASFPQIFLKFLEKKGNKYLFIFSEIKNKLDINIIAQILNSILSNSDIYFQNKSQLISFENENQILKMEINYNEIKETNQQLRNEIVGLENEINEIKDKSNSMGNENVNKFINIESSLNQRINNIENNGIKRINEVNDNLKNKIQKTKSSLSDISSKVESMSVLRVPYPHGYDGDGIFEILREKNDRSVIDSGLVKIIAESFDKIFKKDLKYIVDWTTSTQWASTEKENSSIIFDFISHKFLVSGLKIQSYKGRKNEEHMKSFRVEGSNKLDSSNWKHIGNWNTDSINGPNSIGRFCMNEITNGKFFRYIKLKMNDQTYKGTYGIFLSHIDFYGVYKESNSFVPSPHK